MLHFFPNGPYFHNNGWVVKGLRSWAELCRRRNATSTTLIEAVTDTARLLADDTLRAIRDDVAERSSDWWLSPRDRAS